LTIADANGLSSELICIELLRKSGGRQITQTGLFPLPVVKDFNELCDLLFGLPSGGVMTMVVDG
jgi:hypothetical protein